MEDKGFQSKAYQWDLEFPILHIQMCILQVNQDSNNWTQETTGIQ